MLQCHRASQFHTNGAAPHILRAFKGCQPRGVGQPQQYCMYGTSLPSWLLQSAMLQVSTAGNAQKRYSCRHIVETPPAAPGGEARPLHAQCLCYSENISPRDHGNTWVGVDTGHLDKLAQHAAAHHCQLVLFQGINISIAFSVSLSYKDTDT